MMINNQSYFDLYVNGTVMDRCMCEVKHMLIVSLHSRQSWHISKIWTIYLKEMTTADTRQTRLLVSRFSKLHYESLDFINCRSECI